MKNFVFFRFFNSLIIILLFTFEKFSYIISFNQINKDSFIKLEY
ncbi:hypothetical protein HMPREF0379_1816 [[Eubacterium] yurii subsp. margaretiae ATCC 43715]|nr:hypothetical protein HMPREF0379_1816 [[Eubacterium] yurii subsp. margaretiae ATCC 43715]